MPDEWVRWTLGGLLGVILVVFGEMFRRLFAKQDQLERDKADRAFTENRFDEILVRFDRHLTEDREMHQEVGRKLDETNRHLSTTNATLANLAGRFEERARNGHP